MLVFAAVGAWICMPMMDSSIGSGSVAVQEGGLRPADQSLDTVENPQGAPGGAVDLSMEGAYRKKLGGESTMKSSLYEAPPEEPAAAAAATPAGGSTLADALKGVAAKASASAKVDSSGWGGQRAQKGFSPPRGNFGALSGFSGASGSAASAGSGGGSVLGFGAQSANTGSTLTRGLRDGAAPEGARGSVMGALKGAESASMAAARQKSADASAAMSGTSFDGRTAGGIGGGGAAADASAGVYGRLDAAPINLKGNDAALNQREVTPPPTPVGQEKKDPNDEMRKMITQMIIMAVVGGLTGGLVNGILGAGVGVGAGAGKGASLALPPRDQMYSALERRTYGIET